MHQFLDTVYKSVWAVCSTWAVGTVCVTSEAYMHLHAGLHACINWDYLYAWIEKSLTISAFLVMFSVYNWDVTCLLKNNASKWSNLGPSKKAKLLSIQKKWEGGVWGIGDGMLAKTLIRICIWSVGELFPLQNWLSNFEELVVELLTALWWFSFWDTGK